MTTACSTIPSTDRERSPSVVADDPKREAKVDASHAQGLIVGDHATMHATFNLAGPTAVQVGGLNSTQVNNFGGASRHVVGEYPAPSRLDDKWLTWLMEQPSRLLDVRSQVVPFVGRDRELRQLADWRDSGTAGLSVLLLHAPGGQGKTRLAAEFAERSRSRGLPEAQRWHVLQAGFGAGSTGAQPTGSAPADVDGAGVLLIVDYADRWAHSELEHLLSDPMLHHARSTRVLMIGRTVRWFAALRGSLSERRAVVGDLLLPPLTNDRTALFAAARDRFSAPDLYDLQDRDAVSAPAALSDHRDFGLTLTVHMAALVAVDAHHRGAQAPTTPHELSAYLLDREYQAWQRLFEAGSRGQDFRTRPAVMARAVFTAALTGPVDQASGTRAIRRLDLPGHSQDLLVDHRFCYPPADRELVLEPLYPDRLAEDFIALFTPGHDISAYDPDPWAKDVPASLLTGTVGTDAEELRPIVVARAMTFLALAAERWPHIGTKVLYPLLRVDPALALEAGSAALTSLASIEGLPDDVLTSIEQLLPKGRHVDLDIGAAAIAAITAARALPRTEDPADQADIHMRLGYRLAAVGRRDEALEQSGRAVELRRRLAGTDRFGNRTALARALSIHATNLAEAGRHDEALQHVQRAVELLPNPASADFVVRAIENAAEQTLFGERFWAEDLASVMDNWAIRLNGVGQRAQAVAFSTHAVYLYERLAETDHNPDRGEWAMTLDHHATLLRQIGKLREALSFSQRALELCEELAQSDRPAHLPELGISLNNHSVRLAEAGRYVEALAYSERALSLRGELVEVNRAAYLSDLASSTTNHALWLAATGQHAQALACSGRAVDLYEELAAVVAAYQPTLARALANHTTALALAGRHAEALACSERAIAIFEDLKGSDRAAHLPYFADTLHNHATRLMEVDRLVESFGFSQRAIELREELLSDGHAAQRQLAKALMAHATLLASAGRPAEAVTHSHRALSLGNKPAGQDAAEDPAELLSWMHNHADWLAEAGQHDEAYAVSRQILAQREAQVTDQAASRADLAETLAIHALRLARVGRPAEALAVSARAVALYEALMAADRDNYLMKQLAMSLTNHGNRLAAADRSFEAMIYANRAVALFEELAETDRPAHLRELVVAIHNQIARLGETNRHSEAVDACWKALQICRELRDHRREMLTLESLGMTLSRLGNYQEAIIAHEQSLQICRNLGDHEGEGQALCHLGIALTEAGRAEEAIIAYEQAVQIYNRTGDLVNEGYVSRALGLALYGIGRLVEAVTVYRQAIQIFHQLGYRQAEGWTLNNLGFTLDELRRFDDAITAYQQSVQICHDLGDHRNEEMAVNNLGLTLRRTFRFDEAITAHQRSLQICHDLGDRHGERTALSHLGLALRPMRRFEEAITAHQHGAQICHELGDQHGEGRALANLGIALSEVGRFKEAVTVYQQAAQIYRATGDHGKERVVLELLKSAEQASL